jgi:hypothetical protein
VARNHVVIGVLLMNSLISTKSLTACGDKFISAARGIRFEQAPVGKQESILIYTDPASDVPKALARITADEALRGAGYRPTVVSSATDFDAKLTQGHWDLAVVGLNDAAAAALRGVRILPIALNTPKTILADVNKTYPVVLTKVPNSDAFVHAVSQALASRATRKSN